jgi:hypothetical protein
MAATMLLDTVLWDLVLDARGNVALATEPYALAQDAASAIKTFLGECYWDTTVGIDYLGEILARSPSIPLLKARLVSAALTVPGVVSARVFISAITDRVVSGQVQVVGEDGATSAATFSTVNPQGG